MDNLLRIKIKGFKSIKELDLEIKPINVLIGANGSGKSNFISVFRLLENISTQRLQTYKLTFYQVQIHPITPNHLPIFAE
jgi:predicted ATPase